ncbi:MAG: YebC/PmpR family DNA-binding transcriptional regulator [Bacillales bacterium]|jgi:YebC/PmpR family DNA-binding regulatory protein|nr:YebC/PmpR family DNA-binding transcriptional regulator [Bacillales bacterium]
MGRAHEVRKKAMAATNAAKTKVYAKYGKEVYLAARSGVPDPNMNDGLRRVIERAKRAQVPSDVIKRNIDKAKSGTGENYEAIMYEGFGPSNSSFVVECLTDNINRTVSNIRSYFTKAHGKLGVTGSATFGYNHYAVITLSGLNAEAVLETLLMGDVDIIDVEEDGEFTTIYAAPHKLDLVKDTILASHPNINIEEDEVTWIPNEYISLTTQEDLDLFNRLVGFLQEDDDVQDFYHNVQE